MTQDCLAQIRQKIQQLLLTDGFYKHKFQGIHAGDIASQEDFEQLPFTDKADLRLAYPLGLQAVDDREVVRIHSSSGTTGTPVIIPYTRQDVEDWALLFKRCYQTAGITDLDRIQVTPGYGLWTAGIGFQAGAELLGAMTIPTGPGNCEKQIRMMCDLHSTVLCATSSFALLLAEEVTKRNLLDQISLKKGVIGSERWGEKMRSRISAELGIDIYDIYGLTEVYGPGIAISCDARAGMHYWDDYLYFEIIDPKTGKTLPRGEWGELVITTLKKQGAPLIRYRTHDITRFVDGACPCGSPYPRIDTIMGRTDDIIKVKGVNISPGQIDELLKDIPGVSSEYFAVVERDNSKDLFTLNFEIKDGADPELLEKTVLREFKAKIGISIMPNAVSLGVLQRSEKKTKRIMDKRDA